MSSSQSDYSVAIQNPDSREMVIIMVSFLECEIPLSSAHGTRDRARARKSYYYYCYDVDGSFIELLPLLIPFAVIWILCLLLRSRKSYMPYGDFSFSHCLLTAPSPYMQCLSLYIYIHTHDDYNNMHNICYIIIYYTDKHRNCINFVMNNYRCYLCTDHTPEICQS